MLDDTLPEKIDQMRVEISALTQAIAGLKNELHLLAEINRRLVALLTPEQKDSAGGALALALAKLVEEVERQNRMLENLSGVLVRFIRDMPSQITKAVLEATSGLNATIRDLPGKVLLAVRDVLR